MSHSYRIETYHEGKWIKILEGSKQFLEGYLYAKKDYAPRPHFRIVREDGRIVDELPCRHDINIGQVAGWPTAEQYERAGKDALARAELIRVRRDRSIGGQ